MAFVQEARLKKKGALTATTNATEGLRPRRVLIYRPGSLGDTLIALPALNLIARAFPDAERRMLTNYPVSAKAAPSATVLENTGLVHGFFAYPLGTRSILFLFQLWWQIARWRPTLLVYMAGQREAPSFKRDSAFFRLCGVKRMIGIPAAEDQRLVAPLSMNQHRCRTGQASETMFEHESVRLTRNIAELGDAHLEDPANWDLHLTSAEKSRASEVLSGIVGRPFIAISIGTKNQSNDWGGDNWQNLVRSLAGIYTAHSLVICGAANEKTASNFIASWWENHSVNPSLVLCGLISPRESAAVLERADVFIGHDSGPMHLAAAVRTPCVGIFGARNLPGIWFPYGNQHRVLYRLVDCAGCGLETCIVQKKKCIMSITVDDVIAAILTLLPSGSIAAGLE